MPAAPLTAAADPVNLSRLAIVEGAPGSEIELDADAALVWTSYRNEDGQLVIEIPNSRPEPGVTTEEAASGLVAAVRVTVEEAEGRPLTRLTVVTRQDAQHSLVASGNGLRVELSPVGAMTAQAEPVRSEEAPDLPALVPATAPAAVRIAAGTPDNPQVAPRPAGRVATRLDDVAVVAQGDETVIRVAGNGEFAYSTFALENPARFVVDLDGVVNQGASSSAPLADPYLDRVRVSQFRQQPQPVSRIVFDLKGAAAPQIERSSEGLLVRFGGAAPVEIAAAAPAPAAPVAPVAAVEVARAEPRPEPASPPVIVPEPEKVAMAAPAPVAPPAPSVLPAPTPEQAIAATSDVVAFAPAAERPVPATAPVVQLAPAPARTVRDTSAYEAANMQVVEEAPRAAAPSPAFPQQTVGGPKKEYVGDPISLTLKDADIKDVPALLRQDQRLERRPAQPGVGGTVTVELESVPWDQALDQILKINNLGYELEGNIMRIAPAHILQKRGQGAAGPAAGAGALDSAPDRDQALSYSTASEVARLLATGGRRRRRHPVAARLGDDRRPHQPAGSSRSCRPSSIP
jgi:hypothetical protein